jgi:hypothetical protein
MIVAVIALVLGLGGAAIAADLTKPQVKKIAKKVANKQIKKKAPKLSVAHAKTADSAGSVNTVRTFKVNLAETAPGGAETTLFTHGPLSATVRCLDGGGNDTAVVVYARSTEAGSAFGGPANESGSFGPGDLDERIEDFDTYATSGPDHSDGFDQFSMVAPSGAAVNGTVSALANDSNQTCVVYGHVVIVG